MIAALMESLARETSSIREIKASTNVFKTQQIKIRDVFQYLQTRSRHLEYQESVQKKKENDTAK